MKWHNLSVEDVLNKLNTTSQGIDQNKALELLNKYGKNELPIKKPKNFICIFLSQMFDPIIILLICIIIFSCLVGEKVDACVIAFIIFVDVLVGTIQEVRAEKKILSLSKLVKTSVTVLRNNKKIEIDSSLLVIGDIVLLKSGDKISADLRIIESDNLQVNESILTGESLNIEKNCEILSEQTILAERVNMAYAGTIVISGRGKGVVVATSSNTEVGKISDKVNNIVEEKSPLTIRMNKFSKQITIAIIVIAVLLTIVLLFKGVDLKELFLSVIALSVSAMPEGLVLALTLALTIASNRMGKKNVIVKKLNSVEALGSCTVIASDKTGTLTVNEQTAKKIVLPNYVYDVTGVGYNVLGEITSNYPIEKAKNIAKLGAINNEATFENGKYFGDSIDIAFLVLGQKAKIENDIKAIKLEPYESEKQCSILYYEIDGILHCTIKGSIEKVISYCTKMRSDDICSIDEDLLYQQNEDLAADGYRVIAIADGVVDSLEPKDLVFEGLVGFIDPVREDAKQAIKKCKEAGIKVIMITGDHKLTAYSIAKDLEIASSKDDVATSYDLDQYTEDTLFDDFIKTKTVFTRVTPIQKLRIVESLKRQNEYVAVTGDGVNDAPALKSANIGVAMGSGCDVAKQTADMIIADDSFSSIVTGISEGRTAYSNIRKVTYFLLSCGFAEVLFFLMSIIFNLPMPLVAIQLLWLNLVTDGLQDISLSFEKTEQDIMKNKPRKVNSSILDKELVNEILLSGLTMGLLVFIVWAYLLNKGMQLELARGYIMALMVFVQNIHVFNCRSENISAFKISLKSNPLILITIIGAIGIQIFIMENEFLSNLLKVSSVPYMDMLILFILSIVILIVMEIYKYYKKGKIK